MNTADIKEEILSQFGFPTVAVEIDDTAWDFIFKRAKRWFHVKKGVPGAAIMPAQKEMDPPTESEVVLDILMPSDGGNTLGAILTGGFFADIVPADVIARGGMFSTSFSNYSAFVQLIQQLGQVRRVFSSEPDWNISPLGKIQIMPSNLTGSVLVIYKKKQEFWEIEQLTDRDEDIVYRACLNEARYVLAKIRGKYPSYPAAGGNIETDAAQLMEEWKDQREELNKEIDDMAMPIMFVKG